MKTVNWNAFKKAKREVNDKLRALSNGLFNEKDPSGNATIEETLIHSGAQPVIKMRVNWVSLGSVSPRNARAMAALLQEAADLAENFVYNGYTVEDF